MLLAIYGALVLIDRITTFWLTTFVVLIAPVIIIMYSAMQSFKDGLFLSLGIIIISFLLGNLQLTYLIYIPVGVITGIAYSYGVSKSYDKTTLLLVSCIIYAICEIIASYIVYPFLGFPVTQMIEELKLSFNEINKISGIDYSTIFSSSGIDFNKLLVIMFLFSTILMGVMEGLLIHILSIFLLKRFKIKDLGRLNIWDIKPNKAVGYIAFLSCFSFFFSKYITNDYVYYILMTVSLVGAAILIYYGYLFLCLYQAIVLKKNVAFIIVMFALFVPVILIGLMIIGFLYAAGPLRTYLEERVNSIKHE